MLLQKKVCGCVIVSRSNDKKTQLIVAWLLSLQNLELFIMFYVTAASHFWTLFKWHFFQSQADPWDLPPEPPGGLPSAGAPGAAGWGPAEVGQEPQRGVQEDDHGRAHGGGQGDERGGHEGSGRHEQGKIKKHFFTFFDNLYLETLL